MSFNDEDLIIITHLFWLKKKNMCIFTKIVWFYKIICIVFNISVPLPNVVGSVLKKVIEWCEKHKDEPTPTQEEEEKDLNEQSLGKEHALKIYNQFVLNTSCSF